MGGGAGLSMHAPFRIATERTRFAMPETRIGFFPDVGASFFLPRLDGSIGTYLALTGAELEGVNAFYAGVATHYIDSSMLSSLTARLSELEFKDYDSQSTRHSLIAATIEEFSTGLPYDKPMLIAGDLRVAIDQCFQYLDVEEIIKNLQIKTKGPMAEWAEKTLKTLSQHSPTSLKVALRLLRLCANKEWTITYAFQREYHLAAKFMAHPDFVSGVSARLIHKPPTVPKWQPATLAELDVENGDVDRFFEVEGEQRLNLIGEEADWSDYPSQMGLPRESEVEMVFEAVKEAGGAKLQSPRSIKEEREREKDLVEKGLSLRDIAERDLKERVVRAMLKRTHNKVGVREKVEEVLRRCCKMSKDGVLKWRTGTRKLEK